MSTLSRRVPSAVLICTLAAACGQAAEPPQDLAVPPPATTGRAALLVQLDSILRQAKPDLQTVGLVSLRPARHNGPAYAIVATATGPHRGFGSTAEAGEIFGVFLVDSSLTRVTRTLEILVTPRHLDYDLWIAVNVAPDSIVVCGRGSTYGDQAQRRSYPVDPDSGSQDPARPTPVDVDKGDDPDSVLAHCRFH